MTHPSLYDEDILLWSEQQASAIRGLSRIRRNLPNELDIENVAEEVESVGRSELAAVESNLQLIFLHLIKLLLEPHSEAARHWRGEIFGFHSEMRRRFTPSMRRRIDIEELWTLAREQSALLLESDRAVQLPAHSPFSLDDLLVERLDTDALLPAIERFGSSST